MTNFADNLWEDLVREHGTALETGTSDSSRIEPPSRFRPRVVIGSVVTLVAVGAGLSIGLTATSSPAFAITRTDDGTVRVTVSEASTMFDVNKQLATMGINEEITLMSTPRPVGTSGAGTGDHGPFNCTQAPGVSGPPIQLVISQDVNSASILYHPSCVANVPQGNPDISNSAG